jgi:ubiquinone biosynthesis protein UbiJ
VSVHFVSADDHDPNAEPFCAPPPHQPSAAVLQAQIEQLRRQLDALAERITKIEQKQRREE